MVERGQDWGAGKVLEAVGVHGTEANKRRSTSKGSATVSRDGTQADPAGFQACNSRESLHHIKQWAPCLTAEVYSEKQNCKQW